MIGHHRYDDGGNYELHCLKCGFDLGHPIHQASPGGWLYPVTLFVIGVAALLMGLAKEGLIFASLWKWVFDGA